MKNIQELATKVFISASLLFGLVGIIMILTTSDGNPAGWMGKLLGITGFVVLSSFGISVGFKYLSK